MVRRVLGLVLRFVLVLSLLAGMIAALPRSAAVAAPASGADAPVTRVRQELTPVDVDGAAAAPTEAS